MSRAQSTSENSSAIQGNPIIVDLGRQKRKQVRRLRKGEGKLMAEVADSIDELRREGQISGAAQPIIVIVREKRKQRLARWF